MERTKKNEKPLEDAPEAPEVNENEAPEAPEVKEEPTFVDPDPIITWRKVGGGSLRLAKRLIPPGAIFKARASEIPRGFRDVVIPQEALPEAEKPVDVTPRKSVYKIVPRGKSKVYFDLVGPSGKVLNEKMLTKAEATHLKADLER